MEAEGGANREKGLRCSEAEQRRRYHHVPKWCQMVKENTRIRDSSKSSVAKATTKMPVKNDQSNRYASSSGSYRVQKSLMR